jgi:hypothetical protein
MEHDYKLRWIEGIQYSKRYFPELIFDRIAVVPHFAGLRRFPQGRGFKQWTGDDSKALMKVFIPAITGLVPSGLVRAISAFLEFCYLVRRSQIDESVLEKLDDAVDHFHHERQIFITLGIRDNFLLPRQHSIKHYRSLIQMFGAPNGLCSSITESKHIKAVKQPWRRSSRNDPLGQMLLTNQRLDKLAAAQIDFQARSMLHSVQGNPLTGKQPLPTLPAVHPNGPDDFGDDAEDDDGVTSLGDVRFPKRSGEYN